MSHMVDDAASAFPPMHDHAAAEDLLRTWTVRRDGFYAATVSRLVGDAAEIGRLAAPAGGYGGASVRASAALPKIFSSLHRVSEPRRAFEVCEPPPAHPGVRAWVDEGSGGATATGAGPVP